MTGGQVKYHCYNNHNVTRNRFLYTLPLLCAATLAYAEDWPQFRGPEGLGVSNDKGLPVEVGPEKNVIWKTALPPGHSSPILVGPRIFLTAYQGQTLLTIRLDRASGKI